MKNEKIDNDIRKRIMSRLDLLKVHRITGVDFVVAGGACLRAKPADYDIYAAFDKSPLDPFDIENRAEDEGLEPVDSNSAVHTFVDKDGRRYQFCKHAKSDPDALIASFDFAHCQVGVSAIANGPGLEYSVHYTDHFIRAMTLQKTYFVGSENPLSSLLRLPKYVRKGYFGKDKEFNKSSAAA